MESLSQPVPHRIAHYRSEADRLRRMAEAEPIAAIRAELLATARQYQRLADGLKTGAPFKTDPESEERLENCAVPSIAWLEALGSDRD